jgi:hypothetical protein
MNEHFTIDELIDRLYGLEPGAADGADPCDAHLENCADCGNRWNEMLRMKAAGAIAESPSRDFLAAQRRKIYARLGEKSRSRMAWAPALAAAALLAIGVAVYRPASAPGPLRLTQPDSADAQLFADVYSMEQSMEPSVVAPIHTLFEDNQ